MDQSTNEIRRKNWLGIVNQCVERPVNVSVKQWLADNGVKEKAYYYWLRKFRKESYGQMQVPEARRSAEVSFAEIHMPVTVPAVHMYQTDQSPSAVIRFGNISIEISDGISEELLRHIMQEASRA